MKSFWIVRNGYVDAHGRTCLGDYYVFAKPPHRRKRSKPWWSVWRTEPQLSLCPAHVHRLTNIRLESADDPVEVRLVPVKKPKAKKKSK